MFAGKKPEQGRRRPEARSNRTKAFSYYGNTVSDRNPRSPEKTIDLSNVGRRLRLLPTILAVTVIVASLLFSLTLSSSPRVSTLGDEPSVYRPLDEYASAAQELIGSSIGNHTKLTINTRKIEEILLGRFPELAAAKISLPVLGRKPNLVLDISSPALLLAGNNKVHVLDGSGVVIGEASALPAEAEVGLSVVRDQSGLSVEIGKRAVTSNTVNFIKEIQAQLEAKGLKFSELTLPAFANQLDIHIEGLKYYIKTDVSGDARKQIGSFLAVKGDLESKRITPSEYVDVRAGEKVFYR